MKESCPTCQGYPTCRGETTCPTKLSLPARQVRNSNVNGWLLLLKKNKLKVTSARVTLGISRTPDHIINFILWNVLVTKGVCDRYPWLTLNKQSINIFSNILIDTWSTSPSILGQQYWWIISLDQHLISTRLTVGKYSVSVEQLICINQHSVVRL